MVKLKSKLKLNCMCVYFFIITLLIGIWFISEIVTTFRFMKGNDLCIINPSIILNVTPIAKASILVAIEIIMISKYDSLL